MTHSTQRARLMASSMITTAALALSASGALAQTAPATSTDAGPAPASTKVQEIVVTGSRIPSANLQSVSPITTVTSKEIKLSGYQRVEDLLNQLPQVTADQGAYLSNGATGTATVSLRDLGPQRTLVLIDGQRLMPGDPGNPVPDVNFIPAGLIDRIEVDADGASAVYGSDAVAGVVNFIMKKNFQGLQIDANYNFFQSDNGNATAQAATRASGFYTPTGNVTDGAAEDVTIIFGANSPDDKGNVEGYLGYRHTDPVLQATRDYSACTLGVSAAKTGFVCKGSSTDALGRFIVYGPNFSVPSGASSAPEYTLDKNHPGNFAPYTGTGLFNYGALNYYQRSDTRYTGGFFAHYDVNSAIQPYASFMFMDDETVAQIAPSGSFGSTYTIPCSDPLLSAQQAQAICGQYGLATGPNSTASNNSVIILRRNVEGGDRQDDLRHTDYRAVVGMKGDLGSGWAYDAFAEYGASILAENYLNDVSKAKMQQALNVVPDANGNPVCAVATGGCVPWNIWSPGGVTQAATNFIGAPGYNEGQTTEQVI